MPSIPESSGLSPHFFFVSARLSESSLSGDDTSSVGNGGLEFPPVCGREDPSRKIRERSKRFSKLEFARRAGACRGWLSCSVRPVEITAERRRGRSESGVGETTAPGDSNPAGQPSPDGISIRGLGESIAKLDSSFLRRVRPRVSVRFELAVEYENINFQHRSSGSKLFSRARVRSRVSWKWNSPSSTKDPVPYNERSLSRSLRKRAASPRPRCHRCEIGGAGGERRRVFRDTRSSTKRPAAIVRSQLGSIVRTELERCFDSAAIAPV